MANLLLSFSDQVILLDPCWKKGQKKGLSPLWYAEI